MNKLFKTICLILIILVALAIGGIYIWRSYEAKQKQKCEKMFQTWPIAALEADKSYEKCYQFGYPLKENVKYSPSRQKAGQIKICSPSDWAKGICH